ncbi:coiled-coil domain-containing protein [Botrimarina mediterranea]|uniref:Uncharacterized protein n=1 Tax=Botrimarina mediterranea TaxID=2528022 RepID=A0A518K588_9BACT|nr:hypothetical protein [Botrimarina mediterranea]QDV72963.1 hypothetical protein Spa11_11500 [Botrimarina mediterranea]
MTHEGTKDTTEEMRSPRIAQIDTSSIDPFVSIRAIRGPFLRALGAFVVLFVSLAISGAAEVATDQRQVGIAYDRLETLALRIADAVEETDAARADQIRTAIGEARSLGIGERFDKVVVLLEQERYASARRDQTELATQLEELLRLVMADPNAARLEEERKRLEMLRREIRASLREQRAIRSRTERGEIAELEERQEELADRIERLREPAEETDRLSGRGKESVGKSGDSDGKPKEGQPGEGQPGEGEPGEAEPENGKGEAGEESPSIAGRIESAGEAMRGAQQKLGKQDQSATEEQLEAQRELEAAQREAEERLKQLREEEQQRKLASLAERFRRMHEAQTGLVGDTESRLQAIGDDPAEATSRAGQLAAAKLAGRQGEVGALADQALRVVRADGTSRVFDDALTQALDDIRSAEERLREAQVDSTTLAIEQMVVDALAEMIAAVDESLDDLEKKQQQPPQGAPQSPQGGDQGLVSKLAELRMIRSLQARLMRQTEVWRAARESGEAPADEVSERLAGLADDQRKLAAAAEAVAGGAP